MQVEGDAEAGAVLRDALLAEHEEPRRLTHGFHTYPARMHPAIARVCVGAFSRAQERVLDPFCGSGTVLIEALCAGREATGVDLNPIAIRVAQVQAQLRDEGARARLVATAAAVTQSSLARVRDRVAVRAPLSDAGRAAYAPHVLLELAGLHQEIAAVTPRIDREALQVVFSAMLVKFSRQQGDTSERAAEKRLRKGLVSEFFERKAGELARGWAELSGAAPASAREPRIVLGDARELPQLLGAGASFELVVSSPPYGGTYDYHAHHALRYPWFGLDASRFERAEVGARRRLSRASEGARRWDEELGACLLAIAAVTRMRGCVVLLMGDAEVGGARVDASEQLERLGERAGLRWLASAARVRPDRRAGPARREHLVLLQRV